MNVGIRQSGMWLQGAMLKVQNRVYPIPRHLQLRTAFAPIPRHSWRYQKNLDLQLSHPSLVHVSSTNHLTSTAPNSTSTMTIEATPTVKDGCLMVNGKVILTGVPSSVKLSPAAGRSAFAGAVAESPADRHVFTLGVLGSHNFLSLFRFKIWWMIPRVGKSGSEVPLETQFLLLQVQYDLQLQENDTESNAESTLYVLFLPVLDGPFRTSLQGSEANELQFCVESGDPIVQTSHVSEAVFINSGENPYELIKNSIKILEKHKGTFSHIENKKMPVHLDWFGWCTWDAFYQDVNPEGIREGLESFSKGGLLPKFVIIDDGWQDTCNEFRKDGESPQEGTQFATRLVDIKENLKFKNLESDDYTTFQQFIKFIREKFGLKYIYVWHALVGYWGGLLPSGPLKKYNPKLVYPVQSPGNCGNLRDVAMDSIEKYGIGLIEPDKIFDFYNDQHNYLASIGVDGVKVDVQNVIETLGKGYGGRVTLTKQYLSALQDSVATNFKENNLISCMSHNSDSIYSLNKAAVARASEDFMPREPAFQTLHITSVSFNSLLLGEVVVPDWDMFHSKHDAADLHGAARAISGGAIYVSDKPGNHDFEILRKLVLPDGSVLRAKYAGRPTRDCLFKDPVMDGKSLLKIWNHNKLSGVVGVFNCQGAGSWPLKEAPLTTNLLSNSLISGFVSPSDIEFLEEITGENWNGDFSVYSFNSGCLSRVPKTGKIEVSMGLLQCELYTISPIRVFVETIHFAPIGLLDMYNSGGSLQSLDFSDHEKGEETVKIKARGCGRFGAYSSTRPRFCRVNAMEVEFTYRSIDGLLIIEVEGDCNFKDIEVIY
ncbi:hypothetical protein V2J09_015014 [Rumex salicifolius]